MACVLSDCANCGKPEAGYMGSSEWGHSEHCCSRACGIRYGQKLRSGMLPVTDWEAERVLGLRIQIKILTHLLNAQGTDHDD